MAKRRCSVKITFQEFQLRMSCEAGTHVLYLNQQLLEVNDTYDFCEQRSVGRNSYFTRVVKDLARGA